MSKIVAIVVAGGTASRFHGTSHKLLLPSSNRNILEQSLCLFEDHAKINFLVLVAHPSLMSSIKSASYAKLKGIVEGGRNRQESVFLGLKKVYDLFSQALPDYVLVHDAARPNASPQLIDRLILELPSSHGVVPLIPLYDSLKSLENEQIKSVATSPSWYRTQTPQAFSFDLLYQSSIQAHQTKQIFRDEADLVLAFSPKARIKTIHEIGRAHV